MSTEAKVARHYTRGRLEESILQGVERAGKTPENLVIEDFAGLDQFHVGALEATRELASQMNLRPGLRLLDLGCGIGVRPGDDQTEKAGCRLERQETVSAGSDALDQFHARG